MTSVQWGRRLESVRRVRVGSTNGPKIEAVRSALAGWCASVEVRGIAVPSSVPDQPLGWAEIVRGARMRATGAHASGECELGVGYEDGLVRIEGAGERSWNVGCAAVTDGHHTTLGFSAAFAYPPACAERAVAERAPIGDLFDALWRETRGDAVAMPSAHGLGNVGRLTNGVLARAEYARHAVVCALVPWLQPDLYPTQEAGT